VTTNLRQYKLRYSLLGVVENESCGLSPINKIAKKK
jgi:hypothetical protein